jgi:hypothetical protein
MMRGFGRDLHLWSGSEGAKQREKQQANDNDTFHAGGL